MNFSSSFPKAHYPTVFTSSTAAGHSYMSRDRFCTCMASHSTQDDEPTFKHREISMNLKKPNLVIRQENPVGILGCVSAFSTLVFLEKLIWWSSRNNTKRCLPFIVSSGLSCKKETPASEIISSLRDKRIFLEQSGARFVVMPCCVSNVWHKEVSYGCSITFLNLRDCVSKELQEADMKPIRFNTKVRIGVLTSEANLYLEKLQSLGYEVVMPDRPTMEHIVFPAIEAMRKKDIKGARNLMRISIQLLLVRAVNKVILASVEFQHLLPDNDPLMKKCLNPIDSLARSTVQFVKTLQNDASSLL